MHLLFCITLLAILLLMIWGKPTQVVWKGWSSYFFIITTVYAGRWCARLIKAEHNWRLAITSSIVIIAILSVASAMLWDKFDHATYFHSELLTITTPLVLLLMGAAMLLCFLNWERREKEADNLQVKKEGNAADRTTAPASSSYTEEQHDYIFIKAEGKSYKVEFKNMLYAEASRNYTKVVFPDKTLSTAMPFSAFEKLLPMTQFIRVHRSFILNKEKITHIEGNRVFLQKLEIPIGESYKEDFFQQISLI